MNALLRLGSVSIRRRVCRSSAEAGDREGKVTVS